MPTFGYFHAHYLFSSALILAMSSFVPIGNPNDISGFDSALDILRSMTENGNLAAAEFYHNLEQVKVCLGTYRESRQPRTTDTVGEGATSGSTATRPGLVSCLSSALGSASSSVAVPGATTCASTTPMMPVQVDMLTRQAVNGGGSGGGADAYPLPVRDSISGYTTEMAFLEPTMQDFLAQSDIDLGLLHPVDIFLSEVENLYTCHEL